MTEISTVRAYLQTREDERRQAREQMRLRAVESARAAARAVMPAFPVRKAYLFGSATRPGAMRRDSDLDIAIEGRLSAKDYFALWRELERAIPEWEIELVELGPDVHFAEQVRETGDIIYELQDSDAQGEPHG